MFDDYQSIPLEFCLQRVNQMKRIQEVSNSVEMRMLKMKPTVEGLEYTDREPEERVLDRLMVEIDDSNNSLIEERI